MVSKAIITALILFTVRGNAAAQYPINWDDLLLGRVIDQTGLTVAALQKMEVSRDPAAAPVLNHLVMMNLMADSTLAILDRSLMPFVTTQMRAGINPYASLGPFHAVQRWVRGTWASDGTNQRIDVRITDNQTGVTTSKVTTAAVPDADIVSVARFIAAEAVRALKADGSVPHQLAGNSGVSTTALAAYAEGIKLEGDGNFADAAKKFREAAAAGPFSEADRALERMTRVMKWLASPKH